jgi:Protein of unknown function (DUF2793)
MIENETPLFHLPYLFAAQAQKELTHNEAIKAIDSLLHPVVEGKSNTPPITLTQNDAGRAWRIGTAPTGIWTGRAKRIASWTGGGWRYFAPQTGMRVFDKQLGAVCTYNGNIWFEPRAISTPTQGNIVDGEARLAISAILDILRSSGVIPD